MNGNSTRKVKIEAGGEGVVAHVGLHALGSFADRLGLGDALSGRIPPPGERFWLHDRGKVLVQAMLMLAGGGEACTDIETLRAQESLFGFVPSDSTLYRTYRYITPAMLAGLWEAMAEVRAEVAAQLGHDGHRHGHLGYRRVAPRCAFGEQGPCRGHLQGWLRVPQHVLLRGRHRRSPRGAATGR